MRDADTAMYQAKRAGKARHEIFNENMHTAMKETLKLETELRRAIEKQELEVYYQPIYSLISGEVEGFEALARWNHKDFGIITPDKFITLAEEIGIIDALGEQILEKACRQIISLKEDFFDGALPVLSVNLSCKQFAQPKLVEKIERILEETNFPAHRLKLEITESVFFEYKDTAILMLKQLREIGVEINIDDFGTGYSNLSYLTQLPISTLKIDRSFISPMTTEGNNVEIIQTILALARSLGLKVIAEGVETEDQLDQLKKLNCEGAQGYYFAKPMTFDDIKMFLSEKSSINIPPEFENMPLVSTIQ
jgi:EAL domain-containing protein (putative c-di-GMP-specific phosphodiesterase class I)